MSDSKRANLITVGAPNVAKNNVAKTVRLTLNLDESNESKYSELNYKELVIVEERKKTENGKTAGLDPFSDNDDDVERVARKFEQKYGGKRTYGKKGRNKRDEFADIGAGYDENDSFIDNTDGYDEMFPPEVDTYLGGFYINCGLLEFKSVPEGQAPGSDAEPGRRNKRRISSSSSEEESSDSSSESESQDDKEPKPMVNGEVDSHKTEHRKKKNKNSDKKKAKKIRRTDSSAATSGKQTSDDNGHCDAESDSRTSQSDSLTSKPAPSSENPITSDSSRDTESKVEVKLPAAVSKILEELEVIVSKQQLLDKNNTSEIDAKSDPYIVKLERALSQCGGNASCLRAAWSRAAKVLGVGRVKLLTKAKSLSESSPPAFTTVATTTTTAAAAPATTTGDTPASVSQSTSTNVVHLATASTAISTATNTKRKAEGELEELDISKLNKEQRQEKIVETLQRLKQLIEERKVPMMAYYNAECERVQEERKKIMIASAAEGSRHVEKRLPKRRFPWCVRSRALLSRLRTLATCADDDLGAAHALFANKVLPLFPAGFVRMPTLLRQADFSKEFKAESKRQRLPSTTQNQQTSLFTEPIHFPSSLTVTASVKNNSSSKTEVAVGTDDKEKYKGNTLFSSILSNINKDSVKDKEDRKKEERRDDLYIPPNNVTSITITPVLNNNQKTEKKVVNNNVGDKKEPLLRVKSPAALNEMAKKEKDKEKQKKLDKIEKNHIKDKKIDVPLHVDTTYHPKKDLAASPQFNKADEIPQRQIDNMRVTENNIPRPTLIPVSPTFAKPDKRAPEVKKKKDVVIVSDLDPLADVQHEPVAVDDSSSDVEVIEDKSDKSEPNHSDNKSDSVPSKDKSARENHKKESVKCKESESNKVIGVAENHRQNEKVDPVEIPEAQVMRNLREMENQLL